MRGYREPGFQERTAAAARARNSALEKLRARPALSPEEIERRVATQAAKDAAAQEKRAATLLARQAAAETKAVREREAANAAATEKVLTESELKAARDARYAARKRRKG
ncbi:MAG: DUF6481 family protein [Sphingobium sp.]|jgi:hypothetical protein|nr:DUF6481 family protein [Sphingobium sp.]MCI1270458.1 DUF6481 family protein [Sphingobium sp.]MCI1755619.1 DUF6481 family protein [Sphingobium sp.]MCI2053001.1 DUF6481 family protein [Sphingobium sp.]